MMATIRSIGAMERAGEPAGAAQRDHEAREHRQHGVSRQHIGEQTDGEADRTREERDHLDRHQQDQQIPRRMRHEQLEKADAVLDEADDDHQSG